MSKIGTTDLVGQLFKAVVTTLNDSELDNYVQKDMSIGVNNAIIFSIPQGSEGVDLPGHGSIWISDSNGYLYQMTKPINSSSENANITKYTRFMILWVHTTDGTRKFSNYILDPSLGYKPVGICFAETNFFGEGEKSRWIALQMVDINKYLNILEHNGYTYTITNVCKNGGKSGTIIDAYLSKNGRNDGYYNPTGDTKIPHLIRNDVWNINQLGTVNQFVITDINGYDHTKYKDGNTTDTYGVTTYDKNNDYYNSDLYLKGFNWYLGAAGELGLVMYLYQDLDNIITLINKLYPNDCISKIPSNINWVTSTFGNDNFYHVRNPGGHDGHVHVHDVGMGGQTLPIFQL